MISRYLIATILNNAVTVIIYILLMRLLDPNVAYLLTWLLGILIVFMLYPVIIFRKPIFRIERLNFKILAVYGVSFLATMGYIYLVRDLSSIFISLSSTLLNGLLNLTFLHFLEKTEKEA